MRSKFYIHTILFVTLLGLITSAASIAKSDKKGIRAAKSSKSTKGGKTRSKATSLKSGRKGSLARDMDGDGETKQDSGSKRNNKEAPTPQAVASLFSNTLDMATCDSQYTRCMNKVCASDTMGKCICYEDKFVNNKTNEFITVDGMQVKQGFDAFNYAKNQCTEILDKCVDDKRVISEKYKNFVQRDCLLLSKADAEKNHGIKADFEELKECMKPACTVMQLEGYENFSYPEYSLCFRDGVAKFWMDANCSKIIAKSTAPLTLKQLFLDEMALRRERSCTYMKGQLSNDRKTCRVNISYGASRDTIKASKYFEVGNYMECSASEFDTKKLKTSEARRDQVNRVLNMTATGLNMGGAALGMMGVADPLGKILNTSIDIADAAVNLGIDLVKFKKGELPADQLTMSAIGNGTSIILSSLSFGGIKEAADAAKTGAEAVTGASQTLRNVKGVLEASKNLLTIGSEVTNMAFENSAYKAQAKEEELAIIQHAQVDRASGAGIVNETVTERGNCFLNNEWFASENEIVVLLWQN